MSSSRAVAAARARRAGDNNNKVLKPSQLRGAKPPIAHANSTAPPIPENTSDSSPGISGRLSVSDAFGLVTLRLGRVESILQNIDVEEISSKMQSTGGAAGNGNSALIRTLISRIEEVENGGKDSDIIAEQKQVIQGLEDKVQTMGAELEDTQRMLYKLQSMVIDITQDVKALSSVSPPPIPSVPETIPEEKDDEEEADDEADDEGDETGNKKEHDDEEGEEEAEEQEMDKNVTEKTPETHGQESPPSASDQEGVTDPVDGAVKGTTGDEVAKE